MKTVSPFDFDHYRDFLRAHLQTLPRKGHGQLAKIAKHIKVHPTLLTQVLKGQKSLSLDQGFLISEYLELTDLETDGFLGLIEIDRCAHHKLKSRLISKFKKIKEQYNKPQARVSGHKVLDEEAKAQF